MGTSISLTVFGTLDQTVLEKSADLVNHYEDVLTVNRDHSQLMSVNQAAGKFPVQVEASVYQLTKLAVEKSRANFGFNAAIGPLVKLWHIGFSDAKVPSEQQISERLSLIDPWQIELNDADQSIFLKKAGMEIDLGAIAKGYIADRIQDLWHAYGIACGIINLGGNLLMVGKPPHHYDGLWRIGLRSPFSDNDEPIAVVTMPPCSAVTRNRLQKSKRRVSFLRANLCRTIRLNKMFLEQHSLRKIVKSNFRVLLPDKFDCLTVTIKSYVDPRMRLEKNPVLLLN